jgi:3-hydroxyisobutyrate dehydrogenase-like beta-hydroxyacid dehydrogenase
MTVIALIGLGEVGRIAAEDLAAPQPGAGNLTRSALQVWDTAFGHPDSAASRNARALGLQPAQSAGDAVRDATLVVSAVTPDRCAEAAQSLAACLSLDAWYFDLNSAAPQHKRRAAAIVEQAGGRYLEVALMSAIGPRRLGSPFLVGGPHAADFAVVAPGYRLTDIRVAAGELGRSAATKLCRSVIVKGLEALLTESLLTARYLGVERDVLDSLPNILPPADWNKVAGYFIARSVKHGIRRAEEIAQAAEMIRAAGLDPWMADACVLRQRWAAQHVPTLSAEDTVAMLDRMLAALPAAQEGPTR